MKAKHIIWVLFVMFSLGLNFSALWLNYDMDHHKVEIIIS
jgi:hypothetical protein